MKKIAVIPVLAGLALSAAACSGDDSGSTASSPSSSMPSSAAPSASSTASGPFGAACSAVPASGKGSFTGMSTDPVATAASNNPMLSTLVTAVKKAGLVDTLNSAKGITVFAPTDDAFSKIPKADLDKVLADKKTLSKILTYHVVGQAVAPDALSSGSFKTLQGGMVTTSGSGEVYKVNDSASVVCGNVKTANATVYIIDSVLMPK